jgi:hypothetical protein
MQVVIYKCMEAMLRISLYSYFSLKLAKTLCFSYYLVCLLFKNIREQRAEQILPGSCGVGVVGPNNVHTCK